MVMYQRGWNDQWLYRYTYDAENRLTLVETSTDSLLWEKDARYDYYRHGPLARTTIGEQLVQGIDYAYTLQGWLKGINSTGGTETHDIGKDGLNGSLNQYVARDVVGLNLNYFSGDYKPINVSVTPFPSYRSATSGMGLHDSAYRPLYNGNISSMAYYNKLLENGGAGILYSYKYDQLNRLLQQDAYAGFNRSGNHYNEYLNTYGNTFREELTYDANGNILTDSKNALSTDMDRLTYHYYPNSNKLKYVFDAVDANKYGSGGAIILDVDAQPDSNYVYDEIGNLIKDSAEKISSIQWNVYGKITEINRTPTTQVPYSKILFTYDAQGNRIGKTAINNNENRTEYSWYVRDAQGNVIATYGGRITGTDIQATSLQDVNPGLAERHIYGSSRLGINSKSENVPDGPVEIFGYSGTSYERGLRNYELTNHLGNVLATVSDKKFGVSFGGVGSAVSYYDADITGSNDYYPFGMLSRMSLGLYRYGFNGQEADHEAKGWQNQIEFKYRIDDVRIGRFLSIDPVASQYPGHSPYSFAHNKVNFGSEIEGLEIADGFFKYNEFLFNKTGLGDTWVAKLNKSLYNRFSLEGRFNQVTTAAKEEVKQLKNSPGQYFLDKYTTADPTIGAIKRSMETGETIKRIGSGIAQGNTEAYAEGADYMLQFVGVKLWSGKRIPGQDLVLPSIKEEFLGGKKGGLFSKAEILEGNHMPTMQSYEIAGFKVSYRKGSAIQMMYDDHRQFVSTGNSFKAQAFRQEEAALLQKGDYLGAFELNVKYLEGFGDKYSGAVNQARFEYINEIIPQLQKQAAAKK